jgi:hypothetical protein
MKTYARIWSLWPSIEDMAVSLDESPAVLKRARDIGDIPDRRHDPVIKARGIFMGKHVTDDALALHRARRAIDAKRHARGLTIGLLYDLLGGVDAVALEIGLSVNALQACKSRGVLSRRWKYELKTLAKTVDFILDDELFLPIGPQ